MHLTVLIAIMNPKLYPKLVKINPKVDLVSIIWHAASENICKVSPFLTQLNIARVKKSVFH